MRDPDLQRFIDATEAAFRHRIEPGSALEPLANNIFGAIATETGTPRDDEQPTTLEACRHFAPALVTAATATPHTAAIAKAFSHLGPKLRWGRRPAGKNDPEGFADNHANTTFLGVGGLEERTDLRIGASLVAPTIRYPDHAHPPEEMYIALSDGEWRNEENDWHAPGIGGLVHNTPAITHAMRAGPAPLLAIWCLWSG